MPNNKLITGDTEYELDGPYREGARAMRSMTPWTCNPYPDDSESANQWSYGHVNESADVHIRDGVDVITTSPNGQTFTIHEVVPG